MTQIGYAGMIVVVLIIVAAIMSGRSSRRTSASRHAYLFEDYPGFSRLSDPEFRAECKKTILSALPKDKEPTEQQWDMILSDATSTSVVAGAGSGKTVSLALRVLLLNKLLDIPLAEVKVFSFTKASVESFASKLCEYFGHWTKKYGGTVLTITDCSSVVSTFHSTALRLYQKKTGDTSRLFEFVDADSTGHRSMENPFVVGPVIPREGAKTLEILSNTHVAAWQGSEDYRLCCLELEHLLSWPTDNPKDLPETKTPYCWRRFLEEEARYNAMKWNGVDYEYAPDDPVKDSHGLIHVDQYRSAVAEFLYNEASLEPVPTFEVASPIANDGVKAPCWAALKVGALFLHVERFDKSDDKKRPFYYHELIRRRIIPTYVFPLDTFKYHRRVPKQFFEADNDGKIRLTPEGSQQIRSWLSGRQPSASGDKEVPVIKLQLPGNLEAKPIQIILYEEGGFAESLGLEIADLPDDSNDPSVSLSVKILKVFWQHFSEQLRQQGLIRFHSIFTAISTGEPVHGEQQLQHLLVDEFQDVSPEIVMWLRTLFQKHSGSTSLLCVGDDWQSIYGWRGSSPEYVLDFKKHFSARTTKQVNLEDNFRSRQRIIDVAELLLDKVLVKIEKHGNSRVTIDSQSELLSDPVSLHPWQGDELRSVFEAFGEFVSTRLSELRACGLPLEEPTIMILSRSNEMLQEAKRHGRYIAPSVGCEPKFLTFHRSKGLEADFTMLLADAISPRFHPLRDFFYREAKRARTYADAQADEALRLGYVALTRAKYGTMWAVKEPIQGEGCFKYLQGRL